MSVEVLTQGSGVSESYIIKYGATMTIDRQITIQTNMDQVFKYYYITGQTQEYNTNGILNFYYTFYQNVDQIQQGCVVYQNLYNFYTAEQLFEIQITTTQVIITSLKYNFALRYYYHFLLSFWN